MDNYKDCSDEEFNLALRDLHSLNTEAAQIREVPTERLYVMYTKMEADYRHLSSVRTSYAMGLGISARRTAGALEAELKSRNAI